MINKNFNKRCFAHVHLLNVTMSRCHNVTMRIRGKLHRAQMPATG